MGISYQTVHNIKHELRYKHIDISVSVNSLGLMKASGKLCRLCGERPKLIAKSRLCVNCELLERAKLNDGGVVITDYDEVKEE